APHSSAGSRASSEGILEHGESYFSWTCTACRSKGCLEFMRRHLDLSHRRVIDLAVVDENHGPSLDKSLESLAVKGKPANARIDSNQCGCQDHAAGDAVVATVHRVLHGVAEHQEQHQIEGGQLSHLPLAREP